MLAYEIVKYIYIYTYIIHGTFFFLMTNFIIVYYYQTIFILRKHMTNFVSFFFLRRKIYDKPKG